jgi:hypothetical protein
MTLEVIILIDYFTINLISAFVHGTCLPYLSPEYSSQKWPLELFMFSLVWYLKTLSVSKLYSIEWGVNSACSSHSKVNSR